MFMDSSLPCLPIEGWGPMVILRWSAMQRTGQISSSLCTLFQLLQLCFGPYRWRCPKWFLIHVLMMSCCFLLLIGYDSWSGCITEVVDQSQNLSHSLWTHFDWWQRPVPCQTQMNSPMHVFKSGNKLNAKLDAHFWRGLFEHLFAAISTGTYIFEDRFGRAQVQLARWCWLGLPVYFMYP